MKVFLIGSCRIHRPFNCDKKHKEGEFTKYDCLNSRWFEDNFLGSLYCSNYIKQTLECLINRKDRNKINVHPPQLTPTDETFNNICNSFHESDIVVVEIATIKTIFSKQYNVYISNEHKYLFNDGDYFTRTIDERELLDNIKEIQSMLHALGKRVLFVSHFNHNNIKNRALIIDCLKKQAKYMFDPTDTVKQYLEWHIIDDHHYSLDCEKLVMREIDKIITSITF